MYLSTCWYHLWNFYMYSRMFIYTSISRRSRYFDSDHVHLDTTGPQADSRRTNRFKRENVIQFEYLEVSHRFSCEQQKLKALVKHPHHKFPSKIKNALP